MSRLTNILNPLITPTPDFAIIHEKDNDVWVLCPDERPWHEVLNWIEGKRKGDWLVKTYFSEDVKDNPHFGNRGWMWRLTKI